MDRNKVIIRTSIVGIVANVFLAAFKAAVGLASHSIAVVLDAVNNLSDALSSIVTIIGTKIANRVPDKKHPLGHGRVEYISAMLVSALVIYAGVTSFVESVKKIINPETPDYSVVSLIIIASAVIVKILLGRYVKAQGEKVNSGSLVASGSDATFDAILSASVLLSAVIFMTTGLSLEAYVGLVISFFIIKAGYEMISDTVSEIIGKRADKELTDRIKELIREEEPVRGAYDLLINNYGPDKNIASVHIEVPDTMTVDELDILTRKITAKVFAETGVIMSGIGVYSYNTKNAEISAIRDSIIEKVMSHEWALQLHGFYADLKEKTIRFDVVLSFDIPPREGIAIITGEVQEMYPDYEVSVSPDVDLTDL